MTLSDDLNNVLAKATQGIPPTNLRAEDPMTRTDEEYNLLPKNNSCVDDASPGLFQHLMPVELAFRINLLLKLQKQLFQNAVGQVIASSSQGHRRKLNHRCLSTTPSDQYPAIDDFNAKIRLLIALVILKNCVDMRCETW